MQTNPEFKSSEIIIFLDGPKTEKDTPYVALVQSYLEKLKLDNPNITLNISSKNLGLANSIITGMSKVFEQYTSAIVVEDDLVLSPHFLEFMNSGLIRFKDTKKISSVVGYSYPLGDDLPELLCQQGAECWGWATWKDRWEKFFEKDAHALLQKIKPENLYALSVYNAYDYYGMLKNCAEGKNQSWAVRWHVSNFLNQQFSVYPGRSYVQNLGFEPAGTHCIGDRNFYEHSLFPMKPVDMNAPILIEENEIYAARLSALFHQETLYYRGKNASLRGRLRSGILDSIHLIQDIPLRFSKYSQLIQSKEENKLPPFPSIVILKKQADDQMENTLKRIFEKPRIQYIWDEQSLNRANHPIHIVINEEVNAEFLTHVKNSLNKKNPPLFYL